MASPLAGTAHEGGSMTCELETTWSSETLRARDDAAMAIKSSVPRVVTDDCCFGRFNRDRWEEQAIISDRGMEPQRLTFTVICRCPGMLVLNKKL